MSNTQIEYHGKYLSDFDLGRIVEAEDQGFERPVTAFLCHAAISNDVCVGVVFGHVRKGPLGRFEDGNLICTSKIVHVRREGKFWVITTPDSRFVIATFQRDCGRGSLRDFLKPSLVEIHAPD